MAEVDTIDVVDQASATRTVATTSKLIKSIGLPADAKSSATDTTSVTHTSILKQLSAYLALFVYGAGTAAAAQRTTLASDDPAVAVLGAKADAKSAATDTTSISIMSVLKQLSAYLALQVYGSGVTATAQRVALATDSPGVTALGQTTASASLPVVVASDQALTHGTTDAGGLFGIGMQTIAHGTNPTQVAAAKRSVLYANRHGVPFVIAGHPNVVTRSHIIAASDGAQTDAALLTVASGLKIVVTQFKITMSAANTVNVAYRVGLGASVIPASALAGTALILDEGTYAPGGGNSIGAGSGILGVGGDGDDLRLTCGAATGGNIYVRYSYYTIES